ncbi:DUF6286 domain-containing protein [Actinoplanes sp. NPDC051859]|uniref:DUF6286 domain-containing protein n=1 Tax=Actinoplanes sp. NPDC051859 TaxID=3363909 RepID=UPI0037B85CFB
MAILVAAAGFVLLHDALAAASLVSGSWLAPALAFIDGITPLWWMVPLGAVVIVLGGFLLVAGVRPRSRRSLPVVSRTGIHLHTRDVARLAGSAARDVDGVLSAAASASRRTVTVTARATAAAGIVDAVTRAVDERLHALQAPPRVKVKVRAHPQDGGR